jgi:hypothetical protein
MAVQMTVRNPYIFGNPGGTSEELLGKGTGKG